jgi:hypothetical protein
LHQRKAKIHVTIPFESSDATSGLCRIALWMPQTTSPKGRDAVAGRLRLDGVTIVNTHDGKLTPGTSILMAQGWIVNITPTSEVLKDPLVTSIDATGRFAIPGFNNMHMHVIDQADSSSVLARMLADGVTGFRQMTGSPEFLEERRNGTLPIGKDAPALLVMPGSLLTPTGLLEGWCRSAAAEPTCRRTTESRLRRVRSGEPRGLRLKFESEDGASIAQWIPIAGWESFKGIVNGGVICAVLDEAMSQAIIAAGYEALTAEMRIRFRKKVSVNDVLRVRGWIVRIQNRMIVAEGSLTSADGMERAHAWATFLAAHES